MVTAVVSDTTPLNYLILIGQIEILPRLFGKVFIPPAVIQEMRHPQTPPPVAEWASNLPGWVEVRTPTTDLHLNIGTGEDEAISLAVELGVVALLADDGKARLAAKSHGLLVIRTLTILDLADEAGLLDFETAIDRLRGTNFRIEATVLDAALKSARSRKKT